MRTVRPIAMEDHHLSGNAQWCVRMMEQSRALSGDFGV